MAKRKRLDLVSETVPAGLETKSAISAPRMRMPIADVAGDTAGRAALEEVAREMTAAQQEGRVVKRLDVSQVTLHHLSRDRLVLDAEQMEVLKASIAARGQQTPIEVVDLGAGYGLISGLRRVQALRALGETHVLAFVRKPKDAADAYQAMVEENEIRADLSLYERANIALLCVGQNVYSTPREAVQRLFAHASASKRSKILKFLVIREKLGKSLSFPAAIPEKLGLKLAAAIETDPKLAPRLSDALRKTPPADAVSERRSIERALKMPTAPKAAPIEIAPGLRLAGERGRAVLSGSGVDEGLIDAMRDWLVSRAKSQASTD